MFHYPSNVKTYYFKCTNSLCIILKHSILCSVPFLETDCGFLVLQISKWLWHLKVLKFGLLLLWHELQRFLLLNRSVARNTEMPKDARGLRWRPKQVQVLKDIFYSDQFSQTFFPILFNKCNLLFKSTVSDAYSLCMIKMIWENKCWFVPLEGGVIILSWLAQLASVFVFIPRSLSPNHRISPQSCFLENLLCAFYVFARTTLKIT